MAYNPERFFFDGLRTSWSNLQKNRPEMVVMAVAAAAIFH